MTRWLLPLANLLSAAASLSVEFAIVRLAAPYVGQSLLPWSAAIASVLLGLTAGHVLGGIVAEHADDRCKLRFRLGVVWLCAAFFAGVMPASAGVVAQLFAGEMGVGDGTVLAMAALAFPPSVAAGFVGPMTVRIAVLTPQLRLSSTVGAIYAGSAVGSVAGTAAAGFVFLENIGARGLIWCVCAVWLALGLCALPWRRMAAPRAVAALAAVSAALLVMLAVATPGLCFRESRYTCIRLLDRPLAGGGLLRFMILDEGVHSASDRDHPERLHLGYAALSDRLARVAMSNSGAPRLLVVGGGGATLPRAWAAMSSATSRPTQVFSIELDPAVAAVADGKMWAGGQARLTTLIGDGRAVVRTLPEGGTFDVALMDAYRTRSVPPHLVTREFNTLIAARLSDNGVFLSNIIDRTGAPLLALSVAKTLSEIFPAVDIWMAESGQGAATNFVVAAWKSRRSAYRPHAEDVAVSVMQAGEGVRSETVSWRRIGLEAAETVFPRACAVALTDDWAPVDRLIAGRHACR
jgi:spermidine synthase